MKGKHQPLMTDKPAYELGQDSPRRGESSDPPESTRQVSSDDGDRGGRPGQFRPWSRGTLTGRVMLLSVVLIVVLGIVLATVLRSLDRVDEAREARSAAIGAVQAADDARSAVLDMETGLWSFGLSDDRRYLDSWFVGRAAFEQSVSRLNALTGASSREQRALVAQIGRAGRAFIQGYGAPRVRPGADAARIGRTVATGERLVGDLRGLLDRLDEYNQRAVVRSLEAAEGAATRTRAFAIGGLSGVLLLIGLSGWYLVRRVSWPIRRISVATDALSAGDLGAHAPEQGPGEVRQLGSSFNAMAATIEQNLREIRSQNEALARAGEHAERTATQLAAQQEIAVDLISTIGFDGTFKHVNPAWERTLGYAQAEMIGRAFIDFVHPDDRERTETEAAQLAEAGTDTLNFENRYRTSDGAYRWLEWNVRPVAEQETLYAVARDVTDRKLADEEIRAARDEADQANLAKSDFLSRMSHELRTPLNAILGFGQLLEMNDLDGRDRESVEQILRAGHHLLSLIDEVLDISRIEAGTMRMSVEPVDVLSAIGEVVGLMTPVAAAHGITISIDSGDAHECYVQADRQRLRQVVLNLVSNAVKYNRPEGDVEVAFTRDDGRVRISVTDSGAGIAPERLDQLFVAFDRLGAEAGEVEGTGLGLALSKNLTEHMGGTLTVHSVPGTGSTFTIDLEAADNPNDDRSMANARTAAQELAEMPAATLLSIDDNPSNSRLVQHALSGQPNIRLMLAMQGTAGLELARAHVPDLILLDLHLPDMPGKTVLEKLRADPVTAEIPVIVLSADATVRQFRELLAAGAQAYLTKPLDVREFLALVNAHLTAKEPADV